MSYSANEEPRMSGLDAKNNNLPKHLEQFFAENNFYPTQSQMAGLASVPLNLSTTPGGMVWSNQGVPNPILIPRQNTSVSVDHEIPAILIEKKAAGGTPRSVTFAPQVFYGQNASRFVPETSNGPTECDNCPSLVHLMYNYLVEMCGGLHEPITTSTTGDELINHLSDALCYNVVDIQQMINATETPYRCRFCTPASFNSRTELYEHMKVAHADAKNVPCLQCNRLFKTTVNLKAHIRRVHEPKPVKEFRCSVKGCNKEYVSIKTFQRHIEMIHPEVTLHVNPAPNVGYPSTSTVEEAVKGQPEEHGRGRGKAKGGVFAKQASAQHETKSKVKKTRQSKAHAE